MDDDRQFYHYHLKRTPDGRIHAKAGAGWLSPILILVGPSDPALPDHPITKQEFYTLLADLAGRGYLDNLIDF
jgi:hypothetical protein